MTCKPLHLGVQKPPNGKEPHAGPWGIQKSHNGKEPHAGNPSESWDPRTCEDRGLFVALELVGANFNSGPSHPPFWVIKEKQQSDL